MVNDMTTSDHVLLINVLTKRENFQYHFNRDFPVYIVFGEWFYRYTLHLHNPMLLHQLGSIIINFY